MRRLTLVMLTVLLVACAGQGATQTPVSSPASPPSTPVTPAPSTPATPPPSTPATPAPTAAGSPAAPTELVLMTHDAFALSDDVLQAFETANDATVKVLKSGDAGVMVNQAILSKEHPLADVLYGVDNTFLSRALDAGIFEPYVSPALGTVPAALQLDRENRVTPVDYGDVCLNIDKSAFAAGDPPAPTTLADLTKPAYKGKLVVENPATSSPGLAFLLATVVRFGETGAYTWRDYWADLRANDVKVSADWEKAYYDDFSGGAGAGDRPIVVSYASSPPAEVYYAASPAPTDAPTASVLDGCFRQVEFVGVLAGTKVPTLAQAFVDFMLSPQVQADVPLQMFVFPAVEGTPLPDVFQAYAQVPAQPLTMDPAAIAAGRDRWIAEWTDTVLR